MQWLEFFNYFRFSLIQLGFFTLPRGLCEIPASSAPHNLEPVYNKLRFNPFSRTHMIMPVGIASFGWVKTTYEGRRFFTSITVSLFNIEIITPFIISREKIPSAEFNCDIVRPYTRAYCLISTMSQRPVMNEGHLASLSNSTRYVMVTCSFELVTTLNMRTWAHCWLFCMSVWLAAGASHQAPSCVFLNQFCDRRIKVWCWQWKISISVECSAQSAGWQNRCFIFSVLWQHDDKCHWKNNNKRFHSGDQDWRK